MPVAKATLIGASLAQTWQVYVTSQLAGEGAGQDRRHERVEFALRFGLQAAQGVYFGLQAVEVGDDAALFRERGCWYFR